jgi:hypothetical protein
VIMGFHCEHSVDTLLKHKPILQTIIKIIMKLLDQVACKNESRQILF